MRTWTLDEKINVKGKLRIMGFTFGMADLTMQYACDCFYRMFGTRHSINDWFLPEDLT